MDGIISHPILTPDAVQMSRHLEHLFGAIPDAYSDSLVELAYSSRPFSGPDAAKLFELGQLDQLVTFAVSINRQPGINVYVGVALRKPSTSRTERANDKDFYAAFTAYADFDYEVAIDRAEVCRLAGHPPTALVITGRTPSVRSHFLWSLRDPVTDGDQFRQLGGALCASLDGDPAVKNPSRVFRLAGSISWPKPKKPERVAELTEFHEELECSYEVDALGRAFEAISRSATSPPSAPLTETPTNLPRLTDARPTATPQPGDEFLIPESGVSVETCLAKIRSGEEWHNNMLRLIGHWIALGRTDAEILVFAQALTLERYTVDQTHAEMEAMLHSGREKWSVPNPQPMIDPGLPLQPKQRFVDCDTNGLFLG